MDYPVFQEKHTTGFLWWKKTYYTYYRYFEGSMTGVPIHSLGLVSSLEHRK